MTNTKAIPVLVLTGFLGSGKTTFLNELLKRPEMQRTAVLMNEIGAVGIDHNLVVGASDDILLLEGGCLCCQPRGSIADGVSRLLAIEPTPKRIIIETSGAANPYPILELLSQHPAVPRDLQFPRVITVVDSLMGLDVVEKYPEPRFQLSAAEIIVITKTDISDHSNRRALESTISEINATAVVIDGTVNNVPDKYTEISQHLSNVSSYVLPRANPKNSAAHGSTEFEAVGIEFGGVLDISMVQEWIDKVLEEYGSNLLRIKGILFLNGYEKPMVLQCVRDIVHPIEELEDIGQAIAKNTIIGIGWNMHPALIREALDNLAVQAKPRAA